MKKVWIVSLLILALCLSLVACGNTKTKPATVDYTTVDYTTVDYTTVDGKLTALGFNEQDLLPGEQDTIELNQDGDCVLHTAASYEDVQSLLYEACKKAADDGVIRDPESKEPIDFEFRDEYMIRFGYNRNDRFVTVAISPAWSDQETGITDYLLQWE